MTIKENVACFSVACVINIERGISINSYQGVFFEIRMGIVSLETELP